MEIRPKPSPPEEESVDEAATGDKDRWELLDKRLRDLEQRIPPVIDGRLATRPSPAQVELGTNAAARLLERLTSESERVAQRWGAVPGVIGVVTFLVGLALGVFALATASPDEFTPALWGGVVLIAVGAASATASAIVTVHRTDSLPSSMYPMG